MKTTEILSALPQWCNAKADEIVASPAWAMPCRFGDVQAVMRAGEIRPSPAELLVLAIRFEGERHILGIAPSPRFPELSRVWASRADVPEPILLALAEKECGALFQMLENTMRRQFSIDGMSHEPVPDNSIVLQIEDVVFTLSRSTTVLTALGQLRYIDAANGQLRATMLAAEAEYCAFALPAEDVAALAPGDAVLLPELAETAPRLIVEGVVALDGGELAPLAEDSLVHVRGALPCSVSLGEVIDASAKAPEPSSPLKMTQGAHTLALGRLETLGEQRALVIDRIGE